MTDRTIDDEINEIISSCTDDVASLMERVILRELRDRHNPQESTPQDYAAAAMTIKHGAEQDG